MIIFRLSALQECIADSLNGSGIVLPDYIVEGIYQLYVDEKLCYTGEFEDNGINYAVTVLHFQNEGTISGAVVNKITNCTKAVFDINY